jgi:DNA-binding NtrC family response regulator
MHIIVVETYGGYRSLVCEYLAEYVSDVTVTGVEFGEAALELVAARSTDLVITSHHLRGITGLELIRQLHTQAPALPVIMLSGDPDLALAAHAMGAVRFVGKSDGLPALLAAVQAALPSAPGAAAP